MTTHGLSVSPVLLAPTQGPEEPAADDGPSLHIELRGRTVTYASPSLAELLGGLPPVGRPLSELWCPEERAAIERRIDDVVLLGRDDFGALAVRRGEGPPLLASVRARYVYQGGQRLEIAFEPLEAPPARPSADPQATPVLPAAEAEPEANAEAPMPPTADAPALAGEAPLAPAVAETAAPATSGPDEPALRPVEPAETAPLVMAALEAAGAAALAVSAAGDVASVTPEAERLLGTPIARLRGRSLEALVALPEPAASALAAARAGRLRQSVLGDLADGGGRVVLDWVPGADPGAGFLVVTADAPASESSERLRLQARLVSFVAHDVRESLAAVYCGLRTLSDEMPADAPAKSSLDRALAESRRASRIVDDVLAVSRPGRLTRVELDLASILGETVARSRQRAAARNVELREELAPGLTVSADLSGLERAFGNLIENALQATPHYGTLTVSMAREDRGRPGVRVTIADTGVGIRPDIRPNIFEPFVTDKPNGTGLGLAITRRVVLDHEGHIDFETEEGRGTTFHIWLPSPALDPDPDPDPETDREPAA
jgi:signal transduction histidine kinase